MAKRAGKAAGMQTMDEALLALATEGKITPQDAHTRATDKARFEPLLALSKAA